MVALAIAFVQLCQCNGFTATRGYAIDSGAPTKQNRIILSPRQAANVARHFCKNCRGTARDWHSLQNAATCGDVVKEHNRLTVWRNRQRFEMFATGDCDRFEHVDRTNEYLST